MEHGVIATLLLCLVFHLALLAYVVTPMDSGDACDLFVSRSM
jgi:hypothetical protein